MDTTTVLTLLVLALSFAYFGFFMPKAKRPDVHPLIIQEQANVSQIRKTDSETVVYRSKLTTFISPLLAAREDSIRNLQDVILRAHSKKSLSVKQIDPTTKKPVEKGWAEILLNIKHFASNLYTKNDWKDLQKDSEKIVAVILEPTFEWFILYLTCMQYGLTLVPLQHTLTETEAFLILDDCKAKNVVVSKTWAKKISPFHEKLNVIVAGSDEKNFSKNKIHSYFSFDDMLHDPTIAANPDNKFGPEKVLFDTVAYILYERNSSKQLVGNLITHANAVSILSSYISIIPESKTISAKDSIHIVESLADPTALNLMNVGLYNCCSFILTNTDDGELAMDDMFTLSPSIVYVPSAILRDMASLMKTQIEKLPVGEKKLFEYAFSFVGRCINSSGFLPGWSFWHLAYFMHFKKQIGGKVRFIYTDGNNHSSIVSYIRKIFGCQVFCTAGPYSTGGAICCSLYGDYKQEKYSSVGPPLPCCEIKLVDYESKDLKLKVSDVPNPQGQILVRGANVSTFGLNNKLGDEKNNNKFTEDGWLKTDQFGCMFPNRTLRVLGDKFIMNYPLSTFDEYCLESNYIADAVTTIIETKKQKKVVVVAFPRPSALYTAAADAKKSYMLKTVSTNEWCISLVYDDLWKIFVGKGINFLQFNPESTSELESENGKVTFELRLVPDRFTRSNGWLNKVMYPFLNAGSKLE
ncbi:hypothetical protein BB559_003194 [Furculomyces boomerangus]|uniref:AMP-dependent synthetase/ligase domain-containing protein n=1 Tax=Furculomyces boomerangus TaxID=61424 RepID=A0A2T9YN01_9FUNG|nr:hypothetical protein BB559_003194 [Furculomyces boomerangus]